MSLLNLVRNTKTQNRRKPSFHSSRHLSILYLQHIRIVRCGSCLQLGNGFECLNVRDECLPDSVRDVVRIEEHPSDDRPNRIIRDPVPSPLQPQQFQVCQFRVRTRRRQATVRSVQNHKARLRQRMAKIPKRLRPLPLDVVALEFSDLSPGFWGKRDHRDRFGVASSAVTPISASSRSAVARS